MEHAVLRAARVRVVPGAKLSAALRAIVEDDTCRGRRGLDHRSIFLEKIPS